MARLRICSTIVEPRTLEVPSQTKLGSYYQVIPPTLYQDGMCDCPDFQFRGRMCKHLRAVAQNRCNWYEEYTDENQDSLEHLEHCPICRAPVTDFDTEPEYDSSS